MTVFYTDLSDAWRLPRRQRAVIDMGGIYFQAVFASGLLILFLLTRSAAFSYAFLLTDVALAIARSLNPFLRMTGFWLVSDLFGISNLREYTTRLLRSAVARVWTRDAEAPSVDLSTRAGWDLLLT